MRRRRWESTVDAAFDAVTAGCAHRPDTWIDPPMRRAYRRLHKLGWAHSLEVWDGDRLVGGLYGVQAGGVFTGESMFHRRPDASKAALVDLAYRLAEAGCAFLDVQLPTHHLMSMGAVAVPRPDFLRLLYAHRDDDVRLPRDRRPVTRLAVAAGP